MAAAAAEPADARMRLVCSHGGRLLARGGVAPRYVGGETRVLVVPRKATFRDLAARLSEMAGGAEVLALGHRLADGLEDVVVSVTCDEELAHMRDEYDRLRATRPDARFRVFVATAQERRRTTAPGLPPLPPAMRRVQSEQALAARALQRGRPMRRVQSAQELAAACCRPQPASFHYRGYQCRCCCHHRTVCAPRPAPPASTFPCMSKNAPPAPSVPVAKATGRMVFTEPAGEKARSRFAQAAMENPRAIWAFE